MALDLGSLQRSVTALAAALARTNDSDLMSGLDEIAQDTMRAGAIQHFEFTYELCWKFLKRWLESNVAPGVADGVTRRELFRLAAESRLIQDVEQWMQYHDARNSTSHAYHPAIAARVYRVAQDFAHDARRLLHALEARND